MCAMWFMMFSTAVTDFLLVMLAPLLKKEFAKSFHIKIRPNIPTEGILGE